MVPAKPEIAAYGIRAQRQGASGAPCLGGGFTLQEVEGVWLRGPPCSRRPLGRRSPAEDSEHDGGKDE